MRKVAALAAVLVAAIAVAVAIALFEIDAAALRPPVEVAYAVEGMHCDGCAQAIVAEVSEVKGVRSVRCTFESKQAVIALEDATALPEAERAITKLGYSITPAPGSQPPAQPAASK